MALTGIALLGIILIAEFTSFHACDTRVSRLHDFFGDGAEIPGTAIKMQSRMAEFSV
jgi:hypothetical protein